MRVADLLKPTSRQGWILRGLGLAAAALAAGAVTLTLLVNVAARTVPLDRPLAPPSRPAMVFLASDGAPFARLGARKEAPVDARTLPPVVTGAFLAVEDRRFYRHGGIDLSGLARAALRNTHKGRIAQGGSTITQQLAKTYVGDDRTYVRKARELLVALALEQRLSKDEILSRYLSSAYFGHGAYGLGAAARTYFEKTPDELTPAEAALLAGLLKAPSALDPTQNFAGAQARARLVLAAMAESGVITAGEAAAAPPATVVTRGDETPGGRFFRDWAAAQAGAEGAPRFGEVTLQTTFDRKLQAEAEAAVARVLAADHGRSNARQSAMVAMRPDGSVVAMVGGTDYDASQFNRAVNARRQPGSSFKLFVYLAALRAGATPDTVVDDAPIQVGNWSPKNASGRYQGPMTFREAFAQSSNLAAVRISEVVGREAVIEAARDLGVKSPLKPLPSLALGANEATLLEMTSAYAAVARGAYPVVPTAIQGAAARDTRPLPEQAQLLDLLSSAAQGAGLGGDGPYPAFAKTGTSQNNRDAWFIGFSGDLVVGVWVGNDDGAAMSTGGRGLPAQIWRTFMEAAQPPAFHAFDGDEGFAGEGFTGEEDGDGFERRPPQPGWPSWLRAWR